MAWTSAQKKPKGLLCLQHQDDVALELRFRHSQVGCHIGSGCCPRVLPWIYGCLTDDRGRDEGIMSIIMFDVHYVGG